MDNTTAETAVDVPWLGYVPIAQWWNAPLGGTRPLTMKMIEDFVNRFVVQPHIDKEDNDS